MSSVNFLEKLLDGAGVEWKALGEIGEFVRGNGMQKKDFVPTGFPAVHYGQIHTRYGISADKAFTHVHEELAKRLKKARKNDLLLATTSENDDDVVKPLAWLGEQVAISGDMMAFRHSQNAKYLAYFLKTEKFQEQKKKYITGAKVRRVSSSDLAKITAPIPCPKNPKKSLEIQAEIVRILDAFTELTAELTVELTVELTARKKQYNYYRDKLLSFEEDEVEWATLGEVAEVRSGWGFPNIYQGNPEGQYPFYKVSDMNTSGNETAMNKANNYIDINLVKKLGIKLAPVGTVVFPKIGAAVATNKKRFLSTPAAYDNNIMGLISKVKVIDKFLYYWMQTIDLSMLANDSGAVPSIRKSEMESVLIPIPPLETQQCIVAILDKFDTLTTSLTDGLPREIALRQKQYAYYRDLLLSFPKSEEVSA